MSENDYLQSAFSYCRKLRTRSSTRSLQENKRRCRYSSFLLFAPLPSSFALSSLILGFTPVLIRVVIPVSLKRLKLLQAKERTLRTRNVSQLR